MSNPKKPKREEKVSNHPPANDDDDLEDSENEEDSDDSSSAGEEADMLNTVINVGFDAFPPDDSDFHGIKKLLLQSDEDMDDDDDDEDNDDDDDENVFGIGGLLPLDGNREGVRGVKRFLLEQAEEKGSVRSKLEDIFANSRIGFLLSERFVNIPPSIAVPMLKSIQDDWNKMSRSNKPFDFTHLLMICKQYRGKSSVLYANGEEELFADIADFKFSYEVPAEDADTAIAGKWKESDEELKQFRQVLILDAKKLPQMIELVEQNL